MITRGIKNNNPFNIRKSVNSWQGKLKFSKDKDFEQFCSMDYGLRAGIQLLRNGYIAKGFDTVEKIIPRYAPASENDVQSYIAFVLQDSPLRAEEKLSVNSLNFYWLCQKMCLYESHFELSYEKYINVVKKFRLW